MSFLGSIFGNVNTSPISQAGRITQASYPKATNQLQTSANQATGALTDAQKAAAGDITSGMTQGINYLQGGNTAAQQDLQQSLGLYSPLAGTANQAFTMYGNALGLNGPSGNTSATNAFQTDPGYQFQMQQGLDALNRTANSRGMLSSGNLTQDQLKFSQGLADQGYQQWLQNLWGLGGQAPGLAGAQTGIYGQMANAATGLGQGQAGIAGTGYNNLAELQTGLGSNLSNLYSNLGSNLANFDIAKAQSRAGTLANTFNAQQQADANALSFWGNLLGGAANVAGKAFA